MRTQPPVVRTAQDESVSRTIVMAVAEAVDVDPLALDPPLYEAIDPDALDRLFGERDTEGHIEFVMAGCQIRVRADGVVVVTPPPEAASAEGRPARK